MSATVPTRSYPKVMDQKLRTIRRRQWTFAIARACFVGIAAFLVACLSVLLIDWWLMTTSVPLRVAMTLFAFTAGIVSMATIAFPAILAFAELKRSASEVDTEIEQLEERWTTVSSFVNSSDDLNDPVSKAMLQQVTSEAVAMSQLVHPTHIAKPRQVAKSVIAAGLIAILFSGFLFANWPQNKVLLARFFSPAENITATQLTDVSGDLMIPRGDSVTLTATMTGLARKHAVIFIEKDGAPVEELLVEIPTPSAKEISYSIETLQESFRYAIQAGDGRTQWHSVTALDYPQFAEVHFSVKAPEYVDRPDYKKNYIPDRVRAIEGSQLSIEIRPVEELKSLSLLLEIPHVESEETEQQTLHIKPDADGWYRYDSQLTADLSIQPNMVSPHNLKNSDGLVCRIRVIPDRAPTARVLTPVEEMAVDPDETLEIEFEAHDDYGIAKAELVIYEESTEEGEPAKILDIKEIPLDDQMLAEHIRAKTSLDLSKYELEEGKNISYAIRVTDNRELGLEPENGQKSMLAQTDNQTARDEQNGTSEGAKTESQGTQQQSESSDVAPANSSESSLAQNDEPNSAKTGTPPTEENGEKGTDSLTDDAQAGNNKEEIDPKKMLASAVEPEDEGTPGESQSPSDNQTKSSSENTVPNDSSSTTPTNDKQDGKATAESDSQETPLGTEQERPGDTNNDATQTPAESKTAGADTTNPENGDEKPDASQNNSSSNNSQNANSNNSPSESGKPAAQSNSDEETEDKQEQSKSKPNSNGIQDSQKDKTDSQPIKGSGNQQLASAIPRKLELFDKKQGQNSESNRMRLRIEKRLTAYNDEPEESLLDEETMKLRDRIVAIDNELAPVQSTMQVLVELAAQAGFADPQIEELKASDEQLKSAESLIDKLREESKETKYAFAGLQMVEMGALHVTPARDRIFAVIRQPDLAPQSETSEAEHHVSRARELLAELLVRFDNVVREQRLAKSLDEAITMYEVYVENLHRFLRAQQKPNPDPLKRKMAVVEVDQEYLDRLKEVTEMRRDLMAEFGRLLSDDPRLRSKYMDSIKRRRNSIRETLGELYEQQEIVATELIGWQQVSEAQREDLWMLAAEIRLRDTAELARDASQFQEKVSAQFPLSIDRTFGTAKVLLDASDALAIVARSVSTKARMLLKSPHNDSVQIGLPLEDLEEKLVSLDSLFDKFETENVDEETEGYFISRRAEIRQLLDKVSTWIRVGQALDQQDFAGLIEADQNQLAFATELLRLQMDDLDTQLGIQFRDGVPGEITDLVRELRAVMESITFTQAAATFDLKLAQLDAAELQQRYALEGFQKADELFEEIRRTSVEILDEIDPDDPNIADLEDPTLDQLLEQLEREPDLNALLGLPRRPRNLRTLSDWVVAIDSSENGQFTSLNAASQGARKRAEEQKKAQKKQQQNKDDDDMNEQEWQKIADAQEAQERMQQNIDQLREQARDENIDEERRQELLETARRLEQMKKQLAQQQMNKKQWEEMVRSDQMQAVFRAMAKGEPIPDSQWNRVLSSLDSGLWQSNRRTPPEEYRAAIEQYQERVRKLINIAADEE